MEKWQSTNYEDVFKKLDTSKKGLRTAEIKKRKEDYGINKLPRAKRNGFFVILLKQVANPISIILIVSSFLSMIIHEYVDAFFIFGVVLIDSLLGAVQEWKANKNAGDLDKLIKDKCFVLRDGKKATVYSSEVVVGDIIYLESGDTVPADVKLFDIKRLAIDESFLTGESFGIEKTIENNNDICYAGSTVLTGRGIGIVVEVGINTRIGKIADVVVNKEISKTPLQIRMKKFTGQISYIIAVIALVLTIVLYFSGYAPREIFFTVIALSISAIPEGLSMAVTVALSVAAKRMGKKKVIVKTLSSVESLGSCTVIATDKTGTLTLNEQTARIIKLSNDLDYEITGSGYNADGELKLISDKKAKNELDLLGKLIYLNNEGSFYRKKNKLIYNGDTVDVALLALVAKMKKRYNKDDVITSIPYESANKYSAIFYQEEKTMVSLKGSPATVLKYCTKTLNSNKIDKLKIKKENDKLASEGYRVLAIAYGKCNSKKELDESNIKDLTFVGLIAFVDPVRDEVKAAISKCETAGIKVVMITGDHPLTAKAIAKEVGILKTENGSITGAELEKLTAKEMKQIIKEKTVFARVSPVQKLKIVEAYKKAGEFIAVTGDGVNDAPALKGANLGIAMGTGTDIAKDTASMIIADDNFKTIAAGVEEGRYAYDNIRKVIYLLISTGLAEALFFILAIGFGMPAPLLPVQLLWINLVTEGIQDVALALEKGEKDSMKKKPRSTKESIFNKLLISESLVAGLFVAIVVFITWYYLINVLNMELVLARSYILFLMVFILNIQIFNCRSETKSAFKIPIKNNYSIMISVALALLLQIFISETTILDSVLKVHPIPYQDLIYLLLISLPILFVMEMFKKIYNQKVIKEKIS